MKFGKAFLQNLAFRSPSSMPLCSEKVQLLLPAVSTFGVETLRACEFCARRRDGCALPLCVTEVTLARGL